MSLPKHTQTILYIVTKAHWGGAQRYVYDLACEALQRGYTPVVVCGGEGVLAQRLTERGIAVRHIPHLDRDINICKEIRSFFALVAIIRSVRPVIVHVNSSKASGIGALATRVCSTACVVFTAHGLPQHEDRPWISKKVIAFSTWVTALLAHHVIAVASRDAKILRQQPFLHKKIHHIQNGIDRIDHNRDTARKSICDSLSDTRARELLSHSLWIGTVAELTHNKGHRYSLETLAELCRLYPHVAYIIVGDGELVPVHKTFVREHNLENHVFFTGFIPHAEELYSAFDIYLAPSIKEGLPYTIIEAMCSGTAIVASCVGGIPDVIVDGVSGNLIEPRSPVAIRSALVRLLTDDTYRTSLGNHARTQALTTYTKSAMANQTFLLYDTCTQPSDMPHA